ncbi:hypothetical protein THF1D04_20300 [Vibrio owensii]|uniref:Uncharacterized protein n=1 Tax=Vibrio owensii TaxID=696485 RepID=A0AAU9Q458_9VIBR|nr:hypothetical protein THF1D04_20300 [Vibrio owensii]
MHGISPLSITTTIYLVKTVNEIEEITTMLETILEYRTLVYNRRE